MRRKKKIRSNSTSNVDRERRPSGPPDAEYLVGVDDLASRITDRTRMLADLERSLMIAREPNEFANEVLGSRVLQAVCDYVNRSCGAYGVVVLSKDEVDSLGAAAFMGHHVLMTGIDVQEVIEATPGINAKGLHELMATRAFYDDHVRFVVAIVARPEELVASLTGNVPESILAGMARLSSGEVPVLVGLGAKANLVRVTLKAS